MKGKEDPHHLRSSLPEADAVIGVLVEVSRAVVESLQDSGLLIVRKTERLYPGFEIKSRLQMSTTDGNHLRVLRNSGETSFLLLYEGHHPAYAIIVQMPQSPRCPDARTGTVMIHALFSGRGTLYLQISNKNEADL